MRRVFLGRHLMLRSRYLRKVLSCKVGETFSTIRLGRVVPKFKEIYIHSAGKIVARGEIVGVTYKMVRELTDEDARLDGFESREELMRELRRLYGSVRPDDVVTILEIKVLGHLSMSEESVNLALSPVDIARLALYHNVPLSEEEKKILKQLTECGSLRRLAVKLYGTIEKRWRIRMVVRKALRLLVERKVIDVGRQPMSEQSGAQARKT